MSHNGDPNTTWTVIVLFIGAIMVFAVIVGLQALFYTIERGEYERKVVALAPEQLSRLRAEQQENLVRYRWINQREGIVAIPVERAMELVVREAAAEATQQQADRPETP